MNANFNMRLQVGEDAGEKPETIILKSIDDIFQIATVENLDDIMSKIKNSFTIAVQMRACIEPQVDNGDPLHLGSIEISKNN